MGKTIRVLGTTNTTKRRRPPVYATFDDGNDDEQGDFEQPGQGVTPFQMHLKAGVVAVLVDHMFGAMEVEIVGPCYLKTSYKQVPESLRHFASFLSIDRWMDVLTSMFITGGSEATENVRLLVFI